MVSLLGFQYLLNDMSSGFNWIYAAWTQEVLSRAESQTIFADGYVIDNSSSGSSAQRVRVTELLQPRTAFDIQQFDRVEIIVQ